MAKNNKNNNAATQQQAMPLWLSIDNMYNPYSLLLFQPVGWRTVSGRRINPSDYNPITREYIGTAPSATEYVRMGSEQDPFLLDDLVVTASRPQTSYEKALREIDRLKKHTLYTEPSYPTFMFPASVGYRQIGNVLRTSLPAIRQVGTSALKLGSGEIQKNQDFSASYLENLSQLLQVAYRQYVREHGYPSIGTQFGLPLTPSVYKEINPSGKYADFHDIAGMANAAIGGNRQVEYTDGGMSGTAIAGPDNMIYWRGTDVASWQFDPGQKERLATDYNPGSQLRLFMGNAEYHDKTGYEPVQQNLFIRIPRDTISVNPPRFNNVPKVPQARYLKWNK